MGLFSKMGSVGEATKNIGKGLLGGTILENVRDQWFGGSEPPPALQTAQLDQRSKDILANQMAEANKSEQDIAKEFTAGSKEAGDPLISGIGGSLSRGAQALGGPSNEYLQTALSKRAGKTYEQDINRMQRQAMIDAKNEKFRRSKQISDVYARQQNKAIQDADQYNKSLLNQAVARNSVISSAIGNIGGMVGTVAGFFFGGGAGGAAGASNQAQQGQPKPQTTTGQSYTNYGGYA